jgi:predicted DCC family thiol-disulfide oxidoreductase YuxK
MTGEIPDNLVLFDGVCNLCNALVQFVIRHDPKAKFHFAAIQSDIGRKIFEKHGMDPSDLQTFVFVSGGKIWLRSGAAIAVVSRFGAAWRVFAIFWLVPRFVRDAVYSVLARNRYRWFGKKDACMIPTPEIEKRFVG